MSLLEKIRLLLAYGADPYSVYPPMASNWLAGHTALLAATRLELWDVCELLLKKGADHLYGGMEPGSKARFNSRRSE